MSTYAEQYLTANKKKLRNPADYVRGYSSQSIWPSAAEKRAELVKYEITFKDGSVAIVIFSHAQREGIRRAKIYETVKTIGGLGYVKLG